MTYSILVLVLATIGLQVTPTTNGEWGFLFPNHSTKRGDCYEFYNESTQGCKQLLLTNITKSQCCALEGVGGTNYGWTAADASSATIFKDWLDPNGRKNCMPCKVNCDDVDCGPDKKCRMRNGRPKCVCNLNCSKFEVEHEGPVCGTNDKTYEKGACDLYNSRCRFGKSLEIAYYGVCSTNSCEHVTCPKGRYCVQDRNRRPHCVECRATCHHSDGGFVCGSDNITYESKCHLQLHSCRFNQVIKISNSRCNGTLNTCEFTSCMDGKACEDTEDGAICVSCGFRCTNADYKGKVCGSDNNTYVDRCALMTERCRNNPDLELVLNTSCDGEKFVSKPPFLFTRPYHTDMMQNTEVPSISTEENEEEEEKKFNFENDFLRFLKVTGFQSGRHSNKKRINQTKKHNQSKSSKNRHSNFQ